MPRRGQAATARDKVKRHQHNNSRFDPPISNGWLASLGIPYQCFNASARLVAHGVPLSALAFSLQATTRWHRPSSGLVVVCGLNSRQINHLQRYASETHYRGQTAPCKPPSENACHGGRRIRRASGWTTFLIRQLKGVPKTHVYRIIRSGEVRVNKGRAAADTRVAAGDVVRLPPVRVSNRPPRKRPSAGARRANSRSCWKTST
jgi:hypothetical protein